MLRVSAGLRLLFVAASHALRADTRSAVARASGLGRRSAWRDGAGVCRTACVASVAAGCAGRKRSGRGSDDSPGSALLGLIGLWDELPDIDVERENLIELLAQHAATPPAFDVPPPDGLAHHDGVSAAQRAWLDQVLSVRARRRSGGDGSRDGRGGRLAIGRG